MSWYEYSTSCHLGIISFIGLSIGILMMLAGSPDGFSLGQIPGYKTVARLMVLICLLLSLVTCSIEAHPSTITTTQDTKAFKDQWDLYGYSKARADGFGDSSLDIMMKSGKAIIIPKGETIKIINKRSQAQYTITVEYQEQNYSIAERDPTLIYK